MSTAGIPQEMITAAAKAGYDATRARGATWDGQAEQTHTDCERFAEAALLAAGVSDLLAERDELRTALNGLLSAINKATP